MEYLYRYQFKPFLLNLNFHVNLFDLFISKMSIEYDNFG